MSDLPHYDPDGNPTLLHFRGDDPDATQPVGRHRPYEEAPS